MDMFDKIAQKYKSPDSSSQKSGDMFDAIAQKYTKPSAQGSKSLHAAETQIGSKSDINYCERWVEREVYGKTGIFPSATDAFNHYATNGQAYSDVSKAPAGSMIYFSDPNQPNSHVGLSDGQGGMISSTGNGVEHDNIADWVARTKQSPLGFVNPQ